MFENMTGYFKRIKPVKIEKIHGFDEKNSVQIYFLNQKSA